MGTANEHIKFLTGEALSRRMAELAEQIHGEHMRHRRAEDTALEHARGAGRFLREAKRRNGGGGTAQLSLVHGTGIRHGQPDAHVESKASATTS